MSICQTDAQGYLLPFVGDDEVMECTEALNDPDYGPAESWPAWTDSQAWELGPEIEPESFEPSERDWADYRQFCEEIDRRLWLRRIESGPVTDEDIVCVQGCCG